MKYYCEYCDFRTIRNFRLNEHNVICENKNLIENNLDWEKYLDYYKDLRENGIKNKNDAINHYLEYGKKAGRIYFKKKSKLLIIPSYKDFEKIKNWENFFNYVNYIIYEKDDKLLINQKINVSKNHIKIPAIGEGTFSFLYYIVNNYNNLADTIIYTKSHWIPRFSNYADFMNDYNKNDILYYQHKTNRKFLTNFISINCSDYNEWKENVIKFLTNNEKDFFDKYDIDFDFYKKLKLNKKDSRKLVLFTPKKNKSDIKFKINTLLDSSHINFSIELMKIFFDDYKPKTEYEAFYREGSFTVHKNIIKYHSLDKWKKFFNIYIENDYPKFLRDNTTVFIDLLLKETVRRYSSSK